MYLPRVESCTVEPKAEITGVTGIEIRGGSLVVNGGKIAANGTFKAEANGNGTTVNGAAIAVAPHSTDLPINVTVVGGEFYGPWSIYEFNSQANRTSATTIVLKGGLYNAPVYCENCTVEEGVTVTNSYVKQ